MQGVHVATFASISWETCTNSRNQVKLRPVFLLSDTFVKTYGLQQKRALTPPVVASLEEINFTKIAIKYSRNLTKDLVFSGVRDLLQRIGEMAGTGSPLSIAFNFGRLVAKNRCVSMVFDPMKFPRTLEDEIARSLMGTPAVSTLGNLADFEISQEDVVDFAVSHPEDHRRSDKERAQVDTLTFHSEFLEALPTSRSNPENVIPMALPQPLEVVSLEDELQKHDLLPSPLGGNKNKDIPVMESAFKRHVSNLAEEVDLEAKYAFDVQLQQRRDVETMALEAKMRRLCAEDMQRHLRVQMDHQRSARSSERHEQRGIDASASSFYCDSEQTRLGYDDKEYLRKNKRELKQQLLSQISNKEAERAHHRQQSLQDDQLFLRRLRNEMDTLEQKQTQDREELRKTLTDSWRRDATIKKLVETKKKQRAAEQIHREGGVAITSGRANYYPSLPQPSTPRFNGNATVAMESDFSVGFDIRSVCGD